MLIEMQHTCDMVMSFLHFNDAMDLHAAGVRLIIFYLSHGLVRGCGIELSHIGKDNVNPDLVCKKKIIFTQIHCTILWHMTVEVWTGFSNRGYMSDV